jgi:hypothetical protein
MGVGTVYPAALIPFISWSERPNLVKPIKIPQENNRKVIPSAFNDVNDPTVYKTMKHAKESEDRRGAELEESLRSR